MKATEAAGLALKLLALMYLRCSARPFGGAQATVMGSKKAARALANASVTKLTQFPPNVR